MNVISKLKMDLNQSAPPLQVICVQGDALTRQVELELLADGQVWTVPQDASVLISYYRPDGTCSTYRQLPNGNQAWAIDGNKITFSLTPQMMTVSGLVSLQLKLFLGEAIISTFALQVLVRPGLAPGDDPENYTGWLTAYLPQTVDSQQGQYLRITRVDEDGRVTELTGEEIQMPPDHTARIQALEARTEDLVNSTNAAHQLGDRITALEQQTEEISDLEGRLNGLEQRTNNLSLLEQRVNALEDNSNDESKLEDRIQILESAVDGVSRLESRVDVLEDSAVAAADLENRVKTLESSVDTVTDLESRIQALEDNTGDFAQLEDRVQQLEDEAQTLATLDTRITALENGGQLYPPAWDSAVESCIGKVFDYQAYGGQHTVSFAYFSDHHGGSNDTGALIAKVMEETGIPHSFYCGDIVTPGIKEDFQAADAQVRAFDAMMAPIPWHRDHRVLGEHDYCRTDSSGKSYILNSNEVYQRYFRKQYLNNQYHSLESDAFYYMDDPVYRIRYIVLNTVSVNVYFNDDDSVTLVGDYSLGQDQLDWLINDALRFEENEWGVVFIAHSPLDHSSSKLSDAHVLQEILSAFANLSAYQYGLDGSSEIIIDVNFQDYIPADLIGWFSGHIHEDRITSLELSKVPQFFSYPFHIVSIKADSEGSDGSQHAIDFVTIDRDMRTVFLTRLGTGEDRSFSY